MARNDIAGITRSAALSNRSRGMLGTSINTQKDAKRPVNGVFNIQEWKGKCVSATFVGRTLNNAFHSHGDAVGRPCPSQPLLLTLCRRAQFTPPGSGWVSHNRWSFGVCTQTCQTFAFNSISGVMSLEEQLIPQSRRSLGQALRSSDTAYLQNTRRPQLKESPQREHLELGSLGDDLQYSELTEP